MITYTLQANLFALIILFIVYKGVQMQSDLSRIRNRVFMYILLTNALIMIIDSISIFFYNVPGNAVHISQSLLKFIFFSLNPLPGYLWILYVYDFIFHDKKILKRLSVFGIIPVLINALISIASIWGGYLFTIGPENSYQRGPWFFIMPLFSFTYSIVAFIMIFLNRNRIQRQDMLPLLSFSIPPVIGGLLQTFIYGLVILWPSLTLSLLIIYVFVQSKTINTDFLTGLYNRRIFDYYIEDWNKWKKDDKMIAGFMMDMDHFKEINDTLGHQAGDKALIEMSRILRESFRRNDFLARLGGDEFAAIIEVYDSNEIESIKNRLEGNIKSFNQTNKDGFQLSISTGSGIFKPEDEQSLNLFFNNLDTRMYEDKALKKNILSSLRSNP